MSFDSECPLFCLVTRGRCLVQMDLQLVVYCRVGGCDSLEEGLLISGSSDKTRSGMKKTKRRCLRIWIMVKECKHGGSSR